ncbi:MAG: MBL fold metallo-hydrolase [Puniceicoccaceae bacterium]
MKPAYRKDDSLLADIEAARSGDSDALHTWWLGQSGFLVVSGGKTILFDPYLSDSLTRKYADTDKPHVRITERVVDPARLSGIDLITSSHNHTDHLDRETLDALFAANPAAVFAIPEANRAFVAERLEREPDLPVGLDDGQSVEIDGITLHGLPAAHDELTTDDRGRHIFMGFVAGINGWTVYHSGDTRLYDGLAERLKRFAIDLAFLPINGCKPERRVAGNLDAAEAAQLAADCGIGHVVPHHYDMFEFNTADPADFARECEARGISHTILRNGERLTLTGSHS